MNQLLELTRPETAIRMQLGRRLSLLLGVVLLAGCATTGEDKRADTDLVNIYIEENRSIDSAVRKEFAAATNLLQQGEYKQAIKLLINVTKVTKKNSAPFINLAIAYSMTGQLEKAEEGFKQALAITPDHPVANNEYGLLLRKSGRYAEARTVYGTLLQKYPDFVPARKNLGVLCELYLNDRDCAVEQYEYYLKIVPDDKEVKQWLTGLKG